jgi:hypothetical protein
MGSVIVECIPMMIGAAVVPVWITLVLLLLRSQGGLFKATAFVSGQILVRLIQGLVFGSALKSSAAAHTQTGASRIVAALLLAAGIFLWMTALTQWAKKEAAVPLSKWMLRSQSVSTRKAFLFSVLLMVTATKQWLFTLSALGVIREANLTRPLNIIVFLVFVLGAHSLLLTPIVIYAAAPKQSSRFLEASSQWLERHNRTIVIVVSLVFGAFFIFKGIRGLVR